MYQIFFISMNTELTQNPEILLDKSVNVQELTAFGLKIGDIASLVPKEMVKVLYPSKYPYETSHKENKVYKKINDIEIEISEQEHYELLTRNNGWISYSNGIGFDIEDGYIVSISIYNIFQYLGIKNCNEISEKFGEPDEIERNRYNRTFYYFSRKLQIFWSGSQTDVYNEYSRIKIGKLNKEENFYTAKDVLAQYLKVGQWKYDILKRYEIDEVAEPEYYYRFTNLLALLKGFGLNNTKNKHTEANRKNTTVITLGETEHLPLQEYIEKKDIAPILYFQNAYFIAHRPLQAYTAVYQELINFVQSRRNKDIVINDFNTLFRWLLRYRLHAQTCLDELSGVLEASGAGSFLAGELISNTNTLFAKELKKIEELLCNIIDPENRKISQKELVKNYGYLEVDLWDIDFELMCDGSVPSWLVD